MASKHDSGRTVNVDSGHLTEGFFDLSDDTADLPQGRRYGCFWVRPGTDFIPASSDHINQNAEGAAAPRYSRSRPHGLPNALNLDAPSTTCAAATPWSSPRSTDCPAKEPAYRKVASDLRRRCNFGRSCTCARDRPFRRRRLHHRSNARHARGHHCAAVALASTESGRTDCPQSR